MKEEQKKKLKVGGVIATVIGILMMFGDSGVAGFTIAFFGVMLFLVGISKEKGHVEVEKKTEQKTALEERDKKMKLGFAIVFVVGAMYVGNSITSGIPPSPVSSPQPVQNTISPEAKQNAQKELDELITLSKQAGLVSSYEFSSTANVVYISDAWYTQDITFKKDFMAKIATLKKTITGYRHFELRDRRSDEKVAEVTAFGGGLEVYK